MVVSDDHGGCLAPDSRFQDLSGIDSGPVYGAFLQPFHAMTHKPVAGIEIGGFEYFVSETPESGAPEVHKGRRFEQEDLGLGALAQVQVSSLADDSQTDWRHAAEPRNCSHL